MVLQFSSHILRFIFIDPPQTYIPVIFDTPDNKSIFLSITLDYLHISLLIRTFAHA